MRALVVGSKSRLVGAKCRACPNRVREGEAVFHVDLGSDVRIGREDRVVMHVDCMAAAVAEAPEGRPVGNPKARFMRIKAHLAAGGDLLTA